MADPQDGATPTADPAGSDAQPDTGGAAQEKDEAGDQAAPPGYADFEPTTTPG